MGGLCCPTSQVCNTVGQCVGSCSTGGANCSTKCCSCANQTCDKNSGDTTYNECLVFSTSTPTSSASLSASPSAATKAAAASSGPAPELCSTYFASFDPPLAIPSGINPNDYCHPSQIQYLPSFPPIPPFITVNYVCPQFTNYTQNPGVTPIASYINCANTDAVVCTYTYNGPPPPSNYKCDNNMCKLVSNPALYTNEPDCAQADVGKPCCSANYPTPIESLCPVNATAKMSYVCLLLVRIISHQLALEHVAPAEHQKYVAKRQNKFVVIVFPELTLFRIAWRKQELVVTKGRMLATMKQ